MLLACLSYWQGIILGEIKENRDRLKPLSMHGHKLEDVLRAFMKVKPEKREEKKKESK